MHRIGHNAEECRHKLCMLSENADLTMKPIKFQDPLLGKTPYKVCLVPLCEHTAVTAIPSSDLRVPL